jgi:hypothetical protein
MLLRLAEHLVFLFLIAWTVVFPLATLLSLVLTLPLWLLVGLHLTGRQRARLPAART